MESTDLALAGALFLKRDLLTMTGLAPGVGRLKCVGVGFASVAEDSGEVGLMMRRCGGGESVANIEGGGGGWAFGSAHGGTARSLG